MANSNITHGIWYVNRNNRHDVYVKDGYRIAEVWSGEGSSSRGDMLKQEANTELIALAGNLAQKFNLENLEEAFAELKTGYNILNNKNIVEKPEDLKKGLKLISQAINKLID